MATFECAPSPITVLPCPSGSAPTVQTVISNDPLTVYGGTFDVMPVQDVLVAGFILTMFALGFLGGRK